MPLKWLSHPLPQPLAVLAVLAGMLCAGIAEGAERLPVADASAAATRKLQVHRSDSLVVSTDLPPEEAQIAIRRLEKTLSYAARYWGQKPRGQIECFLLHDMDQLTDAELPHPLARVLVGCVGGATIPNRTKLGNRGRNQPLVVASTCPGVAEHELVHAYCTQTFGYTGPDWYSEGMAEMVVMGCTRESGVVCTPDQLRILRDSATRSIPEVLAGGESGARLFHSLNAMLCDPKNRDRQVPISDWRQQDSDSVLEARRDYLRSWALCYLLLHNPNYGPRFRLLGQKLVARNRDEFSAVFGSMEREIAFEYAFFLRHIDKGYRVDLCSWDWSKKPRKLEAAESVTARIEARRGYQPTGVAVAAGRRYRITAEGTWSTSPNRPATSADGDAEGRGRLWAVVWNDYELSVPVPLSADGYFDAPAAGHVHLRCADRWNALHDNEGQLIVRLQRK